MTLRSLGPVLRAKLFATRSILIQNVTRYLQSFEKFMQQMKFSKWLQILPAYNWLRKKEHSLQHKGVDLDEAVPELSHQGLFTPFANVLKSLLHVWDNVLAIASSRNTITVNNSYQLTRECSTIALQNAPMWAFWNACMLHLPVSCLLCYA